MTTTAAGVSERLLPHLRRARDHIDRRYADDLDLATLASVAGVSKYHFARSFETAYGETPIRYLTRRRVERAQDLLRCANLTVTEICMTVGFQQPRVVLVPVHRTRRRAPDPVPGPLDGDRRPAHTGLLPLHDGRRPDDLRNLGEAARGDRHLAWRA